jgi:Domain of unknown function (DUF4403)
MLSIKVSMNSPGWDAKAPEETKVGQISEQPPEAVVRAEISINTNQFASDLRARYATEPLHNGETPWVNEYLHVTRKSIEQQLKDFVVTPAKAAVCVVKKVPGRCAQRVWQNCFKKFNPFKCVGGWVNVQVGCLVDIQECTPEIKEVIESRLVPVEVLKDELAPTELRVRYELKLLSADVEAFDGGLKVKAGVRLNLAADVKQGLLGESVTAKGALACSSDFGANATVKVTVNPGPALDLTLTDFGFDVDKVCIPGAVQLANLALANPSTYLTKGLLAPVLKKITITVINDQIDKQLSDDLQFQGKITKVAEKIREPIQLGSRELWLRVNPRKAWVSQFTATGTGEANRLVTRVAIAASPDVTYGPKPKASDLPNPLPIDVGEDIARDFSLVASGTLPLTAASKLAAAAIKKALDDKHPEAPLVGGPVRIYQSGERFVLAVTFLKRSDSKEVGIVYLAAKPELDKETREVRLKNVQFDLDSRRVLLKSANWLLSGVIEAAIEQFVQFPYGGVLNELEKAAGARPTEPPDNGSPFSDAILIRQSGEYRHQDKGVLLIGKLNSVDVSKIWIADDALHVSAIATGRLDLQLRPEL